MVSLRHSVINDNSLVNFVGDLGVFEPRDAAKKYPRQDPQNCGIPFTS